MVDVLIETGELHRAAQAQPPGVRRHRDLGVRQVDGRAQLDRRGDEVDGVALAGTDGQRYAEQVGDATGPGARRDCEGVGRETPVTAAHRDDGVAHALDAVDAHVLGDGAAELEDPLAQAGGERRGVDMTLVREEDAAGQALPQGWFDLADRVAFEHLRIEAVGGLHIEVADVVLEVLVVGEGHEQALRVGVVDDAVARPVVEKVIGGLAQLEMRLEPGAEVARIAAAPHAEHEAHVRGVGGRADVERGVLVHHPLQRLHDEAGTGHGCRLRRHDPPGIDRRGAQAGLARIEHLDLAALARELVGEGEAEHAGTDDHRAHADLLGLSGHTLRPNVDGGKRRFAIESIAWSDR